MLYILATQEPESTALFRDILGRYAPGAGSEIMTHAQQLLAEGEEKGKMRAQVEIIEGMLLEGVD